MVVWRFNNSKDASNHSCNQPVLYSISHFDEQYLERKWKSASRRNLRYDTPHPALEKNLQELDDLLCYNPHIKRLGYKAARCSLRLKSDGARAETRFRLPAKRTSPFKSAGASVHPITVSRGVRISGSNGSNAGYIMFRGSVKITGYSLHSPVSPSISPPPCVTVCHHISTRLYVIR